MESVSPDEARRSLESIGASRDGVASRLTTPRWYHPVLGLLLAQMVLAHGLMGDLFAVLSGLVVAVGSGLLVRAYAGRTGIHISKPAGMRSGVALAAFALCLVAPVLAVVVLDDPASALVVVLAVVVLACTVVLGPVYDAALRADLRDHGPEGREAA